MKYQLIEQPCSCGSGEQRSECNDGHGYFLFYHCTQCFHEKRARFRDDIFTRYQADEPLEE